MRMFFLASFAFLLFSCNSSSKKDPNKAMDDTARKDNAAVDAVVSIEPVKISADEIPSAIKVKGKMQEAWKWKDNLGENIFITSYVAPYNDRNKNEDNEEGQTAEVHAFHYAKKEGDYVQVWMMNDAVKSCPLDIICEFIKGSGTITDLDKDGIAEIKVQYSTVCRGDVSPSDMKLIMYENGVKYALRGVRWLRSGPEDKFTVTENDVNLEKLPKKKDEYDQIMMSFGRYETEKDFVNAPPEFLSFARTEWLKYVKERMGEE